MNEYMGVVIGGVVGFLSASLSSILIDFLRARRELRKWKLESAQEFYRKLYDSLGPFLSANYKISAIVAVQRLAKQTNSPKEQEQIYNLDDVLKELSDCVKLLIDKGYVGLFPKDVGVLLLEYSGHIMMLKSVLREQGLYGEQTQSILKAVNSKGEKIIHRVRELINIDALD